MKNIKTGAWSHDGHWKNGHYIYYMGRGERYANVKYIFSFEKILNRMKCFEKFFLEILEMQCIYIVYVCNNRSIFWLCGLMNTWVG